MTKIIKIALIGSHGIGKTGLAHFLAGSLIARGIKTKLIFEVVRNLARQRPDKIKLNEETTLEAQAEILKHQFEIEKAAEEEMLKSKIDHGVIICDRAFDNYVYMLRKFGRQPEHEKKVDMHLKQYPYTLIVKVPIVEENISMDGVRSQSKQFQLDIDRKIDEFLKEKKINYLELKKPAMPYREDWVYAILDELKRYIPNFL